MLNTILEWIAGWILNYLLSKAITQVQNAQTDLQTAKERQVVNDANVKAYEEAKSRQDRIQASLNLLNRTHS